MDVATLLPVLIVVPLTGAALTPVVGRKRARTAAYWSLVVMALTVGIALVLVYKLVQDGAFSYVVGAWDAPYGIELRFDEFSVSAGIIAFLGWLALLFSVNYVEKELAPERIRYYYTLLLLNLTGMIGFVVTGDLFNLFVFMEILSLSGYALVAISGERTAEMAGFKYLVLGAISSLCVLFATGILYGMTGTLNMSDLATRLPGVDPYPVVVAIGLIVLGFCVKAAVFPLHIWLPDAHAIAPSPVSAILSGLVVKTGILGMLRMYQIMYQAQVVDLAPLNTLLCWLGAISIVMGAFFAIFQEDIKMMLAYSTISNIGYIVMGLGLASQYGLIGASVHVFNHAMIKACLFLGAGSLIYRTGYRNLRDLRGVGKAMPLTCAALSIGAISIVGIPPTNGFLCKWYIALGAVEAGKPFFAFALVFGALFIFIYYIRMVNAFYFQTPTHTEILEVREAPLNMLAPVLTLAAACLIMGILGAIPLRFIEPAVTRLLAPLGG